MRFGVLLDIRIFKTGTVILLLQFLRLIEVESGTLVAFHVFRITGGLVDCILPTEMLFRSEI